MKKILSGLLTASLVLPYCLTPAAAFEALPQLSKAAAQPESGYARAVTTDTLYTAKSELAAKLSFTYPDGIDPEEVTVALYKGFPVYGGLSLDEMVAEGELTEVKGADGVFSLTEPGVYCYHISGEGYYNILKLFNVTEQDMADDGTVSVEVTGGRLGEDGFQPTVKPEKAPDSYVMDERDNMLIFWPDEILEHYTVTGQNYQTPGFDGTDAAHQFTTQDEMMAYMQKQDAACDYMHLYSAGTTPNYHYDIPLAVFSETKIPAGATLEEAAKLVTANGKPTVWFQAQIHPNEPAAGEGALVIVDDLVNKKNGAYELLEDINVVVVPRINPDGSYLFSRATYDGFDMNRDHMSLKADELAQLHTAYRLFMAEVVVDTHEFTFYWADTENGRMMDADDIETTPATSLNDNAAVTDAALKMCASAFSDLKDAGLRVNHYGTTVNNPIGRAYFGLYDCLSFLVETRGIGAGKTNFERRVFSQETAVLSYMKYTAEHAEEIKKLVADARAETIARGKTYDDQYDGKDDVLALFQTTTGTKKTDYTGVAVQYDLSGNVASSLTPTLDLHDHIERGRIRPTAYVIPADYENIDKILYIMDNQGAEYYAIDKGTVAELEQYYYVGPYQYEGKTLGIEAGLRDAAAVSFEQGAYVFPMDQVAGNVIAMLVEPDVTDSNGYDGTLYQYGVVDYDKTTNNFPLYRYTKDDPRRSLGLPFSDVKTSDWFYQAVDYAYDNSLFSGTSASTFGPQIRMTRGMLATVLYSMEGSPAVSGASAFSDVAKDAWYHNAVLWAANSGIVGGYGNGKFGPNDIVTREQMALILNQYAATKGYDTSASGDLNAFTDKADVSSWAEKAVQWAVGEQLLSGKGNGVLDPKSGATRAEVAQILMNFETAVAK